MIDKFYYFRDINFLSVFARMACAMLCGGAVGIEREYKRRSAGFRTHILVCLGACMTSLTGQFLSIHLHYTTDMARLGAQVIAGIGFIGAGAIIMTPQNHVRGLTTSAGLWTSAIVGLAFGSGFFEGGFLATLLILTAEILFSRIEFWAKTHAPRHIIYMEYTKKDTLDGILGDLRNFGIKTDHVELVRTGELNQEKKKIMGVYIYMRATSNERNHELLEHFREREGIEEFELL